MDNILILKADRMGIEIADEMVFAYDLDLFDQIIPSSEGKLVQIDRPIYQTIETYYNIDLIDYGVECIN